MAEGTVQSNPTSRSNPVLDQNLSAHPSCGARTLCSLDPLTQRLLKVLWQHGECVECWSPKGPDSIALRVSQTPSKAKIPNQRTGLKIVGFPPFSSFMIWAIMGWFWGGSCVSRLLAQHIHALISSGKCPCYECSHTGVTCTTKIRPTKSQFCEL